MCVYVCVCENKIMENKIDFGCEIIPSQQLIERETLKLVFNVII